MNAKRFIPALIVLMVALLLASFVLAIIATWTGDDRWGLTAALCFFAGMCSCSAALAADIT